PDVMRLVEGKRGQVPMRLELIIRFDYGSIIPWVRRTDSGIRATAGPDTLYFRTDLPLHGEDEHTIAEFTVAAGQRHCMTLTWESTYQPEPAKKDVEQSLRDTEAWWREWSSRCTYHGEWRDAVLRSLITLKALTYAPTGGVVAAPTTSLPEQLGGVRNW